MPTQENNEKDHMTINESWNPGESKLKTPNCDQNYGEHGPNITEMSSRTTPKCKKISRSKKTHDTPKIRFIKL